MKWMWQSIVTFLLLQASCTNQQSKVLQLSDFKGVWINKAYLQALEETHSPCAALGTPHASIPYIDVSRNGMQWLEGFHEGNGFGIKDFKKSIETNMYEFSRQTEEGTILPQKFIISSMRPNEVTWTTTREVYGKETKQFSYDFIKLNEKVEYRINHIVLTGKYLDNDGNIYIFSDSGRATWPSGGIEYKLTLDCFLVDMDCLVNRSEKNTTTDNYVIYGFKRDVQTLLLYRALPAKGGRTFFEDSPFCRLSKVD
jgi:hypothetical protein